MALSQDVPAPATIKEKCPHCGHEKERPARKPTIVRSADGKLYYCAAEGEYPTAWLEIEAHPGVPSTEEVDVATKASFGPGIVVFEDKATGVKHWRRRYDFWCYEIKSKQQADVRSGKAKEWIDEEIDSDDPLFKDFLLGGMRR